MVGHQYSPAISWEMYLWWSFFLPATSMILETKKRMHLLVVALHGAALPLLGKLVSSQATCRLATPLTRLIHHPEPSRSAVPPLHLHDTDTPIVEQVAHGLGAAIGAPAWTAPAVAVTYMYWSTIASAQTEASRVG